MKMVKFPKNQRASLICEEWSKDFLQKNQESLAGFWSSMSMAFKLGVEMNADAVSVVKSDLDARVRNKDFHKHFKDRQLVATLDEIQKEAEYLKRVVDAVDIE